MSFKQYRMDGLTEREKAERRRRLQLKSRFSVDQPTSDKPKKDREFLAPLKSEWKPKRKGNGCRLSPEARAMVEQRNDARKDFFLSLGVRL